MEDEYSGLKQDTRSWTTVLLPVMGFLLAGTAAIIAFIAAEPATDLLRKNLSGIPDEQGVQIAVGFGIFLVLMLVFAMLYAILAPKPPKMSNVTERELDKEKKARQREKLEQKRRRRAINSEMARRNREQDNQ